MAMGTAGKTFFTRLAFSLVAVMLLSGCMTKLDQLRRARPVGTHFHIVLAQKYLEFAEREADMYDWWDSRYFAMKGLEVARGVTVEPDKLRKWHIPREVVPVTEQARAYLMQVLNDDSRKRYPEAAADAQYHFDCWLEEQEENWQEEDIATCREGFYKALDRLFELTSTKPIPQATMQPAEAGDAMMSGKSTGAPQDDPFAGLGWDLYNRPSGAPGGMSDKAEEMAEAPQTAEPAMKAKGAQVETDVVYFGFNSDRLDAEAKKAVSRIAEMVRGKPKYEIVLNGHTDSAGKDDYNLKLSKKRAMQVKDALVKAGVQKDAISLFAFGESDIKTPTKKGKPNRHNRRVEVLVAF